MTLLTVAMYKSLVLVLITMQVLEGHSDEIFSCAFNYEGDTIITGTCLTIIIGNTVEPLLMATP